MWDSQVHGLQWADILCRKVIDYSGETAVNLVQHGGMVTAANSCLTAGL